MTYGPIPTSLDTLNPRQLVRIEATHGGFFYQHVYAAIILLRAESNGVRSVAIERDEDIEVEIAGGRIYLQVKTRRSDLAPISLQSSRAAATTGEG